MDGLGGLWRCGRSLPFVLRACLGLCWTSGVVAAADDAVRVVQTLDAKGEIFAPTGRGADPVRRPITVAGRFHFVQEPAPPAEKVPPKTPEKGQTPERDAEKAEKTEKGQASFGPSSGREMSSRAIKVLAVRRYDEAGADLWIDGVPTASTLGLDARTVQVAIVGTAPAPHLADAPLTREEADLLNLPLDPLLLERLRPAGGPGVGMTWKVAADAAAGLLAIDAIESGGLSGAVVEIAREKCTLKVSGTVEGAVDGVPTRLVVDAIGTVPIRPAGAPDAGEIGGENGDFNADETAPGLEFAGLHDRWVATIREHRQASHVAPGFKLEARVTVSCLPITAPRGGDAGQTPADSPTTVPSAARRPAGGGPGRIWYHDPAGRYDLVHDARWRLVEEGDAGAIFRFIDRGTLVGQCSITALPRVSAAVTTGVAEVQRDIENSLGSQFGQFAGTAEAVEDDGTRIVRVVSLGTAESLPFRWIHHVITDSRGRRATAAFMVQESLAGRLGDADRDMIAGLRFPQPGDGSGRAADTVEKPVAREARLPRETAPP